MKPTKVNSSSKHMHFGMNIKFHLHRQKQTAATFMAFSWVLAKDLKVPYWMTHPLHLMAFLLGSNFWGIMITMDAMKSSSTNWIIYSRKNTILGSMVASLLLLTGFKLICLNLQVLSPILLLITGKRECFWPLFKMWAKLTSWCKLVEIKWDGIIT